MSLLLNIPTLSVDGLLTAEVGVVVIVSSPGLDFDAMKCFHEAGAVPASTEGSDVIQTPHVVTAPG